VLAVARKERDLFWRLVEFGERQAGLDYGVLQQLQIFVTQPFSAEVLHFTTYLRRPIAEEKAYQFLLKLSSPKM
jgi:hypothetical protein